MYKLTQGGAKNLDTGGEFPFVDGNADYEVYKMWLAAGNTPLPADVIDDRPAVFDDYRARRDIYLNRLAGIAVFESAVNLAQACKQFRQDLLNIPQDPRVLAATDAASLTSAILAAYTTAKNNAKATCPAASALFDKVAK